MLRFNTKAEFEKYFRKEILPEIRKHFDYGNGSRFPDYPARREEWNATIDSMVREGELPERAVNWLCPW